MYVDPTGDVAGVAAWLAGAVAGWLAIGATLAVVGRGGGLLARTSRLLLRLGYPALIRRILAGVAGGLLAVSAPTAASADTRPAPAPVVAPAPLASNTVAPEPLDWPMPARLEHAYVVVQPGDSLWRIARAALRRSSNREPSAVAVAAAWPRWWAANSDVIGPDPNLLHAGEQLRPPPTLVERSPT